MTCATINHTNPKHHGYHNHHNQQHSSPQEGWRYPPAASASWFACPSFQQIGIAWWFEAVVRHCQDSVLSESFGQEESFCETMTSMLMMQKWNKLAAKSIRNPQRIQGLFQLPWQQTAPGSMNNGVGTPYLDLIPIGTNQDLSASWMDCSAVWCSLRLMRSSNKDNLRRLQLTKSLVPWQTNGVSVSNRLYNNN